MISVENKAALRSKKEDWVGFLTINNGWGPKNEVLDLFDPLTINRNSGIKVEPYCEMEGYGEKPEEWKTKSKDHQYTVELRRDKLLDFVKLVSTLPSVRYFELKGVRTNSLIILKDDSNVIFIKGKPWWKCFSSNYLKKKD